MMWACSKQGKREPSLRGLGFATALVLVTLVTLAAPAAAHLDYPKVIQEYWGGDCAPLCTLCHTRPEGGASDNAYLKPSLLDPGHVRKDLGDNRGEGEFFANLIAVNLKPPTDNDALIRLLNTLDRQPCSADTTLPGNTMLPCDSDGDKLQDTKEFAQSQDPNVAGGDLCIGPKYGCGASITPHASSVAGWPSALFAVLAVAFGFIRRLRR